MATIEAYTLKGGETRYRVRYRTPDHRQTDRRGFKTKRDANDFLASVTVEMNRGEYVPPVKSRTTIDALAVAFLASKKATLKHSSYASTETGWRVHVQPRWGAITVGKVTTGAVQSWINDLVTGGASPSLVHRVHGVLSAILDNAVKDNLVATNRARDVELPRRRQARRAYLTLRQLEALANEAKGHGDLVRVLGYCGLRWSEAIALRSRHVDVERRRLTIDEAAVQTGSIVYLGTPKDHERRSVPVPASILGTLEARMSGPEMLLFGQGATGHLRRPDNKGGWFKAALARVRAADETMPVITVHDLRHTAASLAVSAGANVKAVQRMLGHASAALTLDIYADLFDDDLDGVAVALDAARLAECGQNVGTGDNSADGHGSTSAQL